MNNDEIRKRIEVIERTIKINQGVMNDLRLNYAQPYLKNFKKEYLWQDEDALHRYTALMNDTGNLMIEKRQLERSMK